MTKPNTWAVLAFLAGIIVLLGGVSILKGGLYVGKHEADALHVVQIVTRMLNGELPHLDFVTPIGAFAFAPIVWIMKTGQGLGLSLILSQVALAIVFLPLVMWIGARRLNTALLVLFGGYIMVLLLALLHGEAERSVSVSMHYNRWAWAAAYVAIVAAVLKPRSENGAIADGVIIGLMVTMMAMIKATYVAVFAPVLVIALLMTGQRKALLAALATGLAALVAMTAFLGVTYWISYVQDLLVVSRSDVRSAPGFDFLSVINAPLYRGGSFAALAAVIFLRQAKKDDLGLLILLLFPGFVFVTYQNFGNDPQWLVLLAILVFAARPGEDVVNGLGWNMRQTLNIVGAMALAFGSASFFNLAYSPQRHFGVPEDEYGALVPGVPYLEDFKGYNPRIYRIQALYPVYNEGPRFDEYEELADRLPEVTFNGETFELCQLSDALPTYFRAVAQDIDDAGLGAGKSAFVIDLFPGYWLFGDLEPLTNGAPWYYGDLPGYEDADYVLLPTCSLVSGEQIKIAELLETTGDTFVEVRRHPFYVLYEIERAGEG